ncbi:hypothetical protein ACA910_018185 [Epithemia clementina (nom. ined.)]
MVSNVEGSPELSATPVTPPNKRSTRMLEQHSSERRPPANRHFVEHKYHDHYNDPIADPNIMDQYGGDHSRSISSSQRGTATLAFPEKLFSMLVASERDGYEDVVSWKPHGRCFIIRKKDVFVTEIMPRFFHQTKLTSFQRQLNLYGFIRLTAGRDRGGYYHEYFIRGRPDLCRFMVRTRVKGNGLKAASSPETEPDFYAMEPCVERPLPSDCEGIKTEPTERPNTVKPKRTKSSPPPLPASTTSNTNTEKEILPVQVDCEAHYRAFTKDKGKSLSSFARPSFGRPSPLEMKPRVISPPPLAIPSDETDKNLDHAPEDDSLASQQPSSSSAPSSGDVVYFEGLQFHYLDHMELDEVGEILAEPA